jgi:pimeloyl-ACP methyl ester carboxylesterase/predicted enzyme related to lactoylglutathione lyase
MRALFLLAFATVLVLSARAQNAIESADRVTLRDEKRGKDIELYAAWPKGEGSCPVIVFSHGAGGSGSSYAPLIEDWAAHGYAVLAPTHDDSLRRGGDIRSAVNKALTDVNGFVERVNDVKYLLDHCAEVEAKFPGLKGRLDAQHVGVGGHSYGAYTAVLVAGARVKLPGRAPGESFADARPVAFLLLSPQGRSPEGDLRGLNDDSWKVITRPMFTLTGTRDFNTSGEGAEWRLETIRLAAPGERFGVSLDGASHMTFTGQPALGKGLGAPRDEAGRVAEARVFGETRTLTLGFWNATLKGDTKAREELQKRPGLVKPQAESTGTVRAASLIGVTLVAQDAELVAEFYSRILGVEVPSPDATGVRVLVNGPARLRILSAPSAKRAPSGHLGCSGLTLILADFDAAVRRLGESGGTAPPVQEFMIGVRFAILQDPEGNQVELGGFEPALAKRLGLPVPGLMVSVNVASIAKSREFFTQQLGLPEQPARPSASGTRYAFGRGGFLKVWERPEAAPLASEPLEAMTGFRQLTLFSLSPYALLRDPDGMRFEAGSTSP